MGFLYRSVSILPSWMEQEVSRNGMEFTGGQEHPELLLREVWDIVNFILGWILFISSINLWSFSVEPQSDRIS